MKLRKLIDKYKNNSEGNFSIMFAVSLTVLILMAGGAIEVSNLYAEKTKLQDQLDSAVLAIVMSDLEAGNEVAFATDLIRSTGYANEIISLDVSYEAESEVTLAGKVEPVLYFSKLLKFTPKVAASSTATKSSSAPNAVDLVMVLDTTESMEGQKISALKSAANALVAEIPDNADVQIGIVPFSNYVNVGVENRNASWINVDSDSSLEETYTRRVLIQPAICRGSGEAVSIRDGVAYTPSGSICHSYIPAVYEDGSLDTRTVEFTWTGCVFSRNAGGKDLHLLDSEYDHYKVQGQLRGTCAQPLLPLTSEITDVKKHINALAVDKDTYMPAGIMWGRRVLSPHEPFTGSRKAEGMRQVMLIMSDGQNSMHKWGQSHGTSDPTDAQDIELLDKTNQDTATLCELAKSDDIEIYSIAFDVSDKETRRLLEDCASEHSKYFDAKNSSQLIKAFEDIAGQLAEGNNARLSR